MKSKIRLRGFTMIELLVVMFIIGVLVGMLFVGISVIRKMVDKARAQQTLANMASGLIALKHSRDYKGFVTSYSIDASGNEGYYTGTKIDLQSQNPADLDQHIFNDNIARELRPGDERFGDPATYKRIINTQGKTYFEFDEHREFDPSIQRVVDPWGQRYMFAITKVINEDGSDYETLQSDGTKVKWRMSILWSRGPKGLEGGGDVRAAILAGSTDFGGAIWIEVSRYDVPKPP